MSSFDPIPSHRSIPSLVATLAAVGLVSSFLAVPALAQDDAFFDPMEPLVKPKPVDRIITEHMPEDFPLLPVPKSNPLTEAKIALGEDLFFDPVLSADGSVSCASCHKPENYFADTVALSIGVGGSEGPRNTPTVLNSAYYPRLLGDGRSFDLEDQVRYPITHELEMKTTPEAVVETLRGHDTYPARFAEVFGEGEITYEKLTEALASFERTLFSGNSPFDRFYFQGDSSDFTDAAKRGWLVFQSSGRCIQCHRFDAEDPFFSDHDYHNTGISWDTKKPHLGRYMVTKAREDKGRQRTPPLRDVGQTPPYMHDGRFETLEEVVEFYRAGGIDNYFIDEKMQPLEIDDQQAADLVAFLHSLTGEMSYPYDNKKSKAEGKLAEAPTPSKAAPSKANPVKAAPVKPTLAQRVRPDLRLAELVAESDGSAQPIVEVVAGSHFVGDGEPATEAVLATIGGVLLDAEGNLYFSDSGHNRVRRVDAKTGTIETVAGTGYLAGDSAGTGRALETHLKSPGPLALSGDGRHLYLGEILGRKIRKLDLEKGTLEDIALPEEGFGDLSGILWEADGLALVDSRFGQLWKQDGDGWKELLPESARVAGGARSIARDGQGRLVVAEYFGHRILRWDPKKGAWETLAGTGEKGKSPGGKAAEAKIRTPDGVAIDPKGNIYFSDMGNRRLCRIDVETGMLEVVHQAGRRGTPARYTPGPLALDGEGGLWIGDVYANRILRFAAGMEPITIAGGGPIGDGGPASEAHLSHPGSVVADAAGNIYIADAVQHRVRRVDAETGRITTVAGSGAPGYNGDVIPATEAWLSYPAEILVDPEGKRLFIADYYNHRVRLVDLRGGSIVTVAGSGQAGEAGDGGPAPFADLINPHALFLDRETDSLVIASAVSSRLRSVSLENGTIETLGIDQEISPNLAFYSITQWNDGLVLTSPRPSGVYYLKNGKLGSLLTHPDVYFPQDVAVSPSGELYICETGRNRILKWKNGGVEVVLENLGRPRAIHFDANGDLLVADTFHNRVLRAKIGTGETPAIQPFLRERPVKVASSLARP